MVVEVGSQGLDLCLGLPYGVLIREGWLQARLILNRENLVAICFLEWQEVERLLAWVPLVFVYYDR